MVVAAVKPSTDLIFRAFADRTRLRILSLLGHRKTGGELCVCDLVRIIGVPQPKISRHLAYLRKARLVRQRRQGLWMYYALAPATTEFHRRMLDCLTCCLADVPELVRDARQLAKTCGDGCCP